MRLDRREFLRRSSSIAGGFALAPLGLGVGCAGVEKGASDAAGTARVAAPPPPFRISLAQWSLEKSLFAQKLDHLDFPLLARRQLGLDCVEYVDQFFADKSKDTTYLGELKRRCDGEGVRSGLIMLDTAGELAGPDAEKRKQAVEAHKAWIDAAAFLGCHSVRSNAWGEGPPDEVLKRYAECASQLAEYSGKRGLNFILENHGGPSSDGDWVVRLLKEVNSPWFGTLPDFGNFDDKSDPYKAIAQMMPGARQSVSAKSERFDAAGKILDTDYDRMMKIVLDAGFRGWLGIESEPDGGAGNGGIGAGEMQAIRWTQAALERVRAAQPVLKPLFNGRDLTGWQKVCGGDWSIEEGGVLVARNGQDWSTNPEKTGSWLRTEREYGDFEFSLEFQIAAPNSNSGVFIRSGLERNPAFNGYEAQIHDSAGKPASKGGPGSLYDYAAPSKNRVLPVGQWNQYRVIARGPRIQLHLNGEQVLDVQGDRRNRGYLGLQNHDQKSVVKFRNIFLAEL